METRIRTADRRAAGTAANSAVNWHGGVLSENHSCLQHIFHHAGYHVAGLFICFVAYIKLSKFNSY